MTCEVAVMNKRGIALAADSAVTLGAGQKVYHNAEKLFQLSKSTPIAVMIYGNADLMGVPWEIVVKSCGRQFGDRKFDQVEQCALEFLRVIEANDAFFPQALQEREFRGTVGSYWLGEFVRPLTQLAAADDKPAKLAAMLKKDIEYWRRLEPIAELGEEYGDAIVARYGKILDELETQLFSENVEFGRLSLTPEHKRDLLVITRNMYTQRWFHPVDLSGVVFAGMGESELFPVCLEYHVGTIAAGRLRYTKVSDVHVTHDMSACVAPFGEVDTVNMFYRGISRGLHEKLIETAAAHVSRVAGGGNHQAVVAELIECVEEEINRRYRQPLMTAVDALPRHDLATMAEALVSLTALRARMSAREKETVAGPIDVAVLSKGEGFVWVKRKDGVGTARSMGQFVVP